MKGMHMSSYTTLPQSSIRRAAKALLAITAVSVMGLAAAQAPAAPQAGGHGGHSARGGQGMERMGERRIDHMIKQVDGTPEQKAKLTQLAQAAQKDLQPLREQLMSARKKGMELLAAPTVDRPALERLRAEQTQLTDALSKRMVAHMADAAEVFTPAQRAKLAEKMKSRSERGGHGGGHGGGHRGGMGWFR
jgi:Spy/CpxP family protein refolding chaperone